MAKDPAFPFYCNDFLTGVTFLTMEERGIYITLLAMQWNICKIPKKRLGFLLGCEWDSLGEELRNKFQQDKDSIWNVRLEQEREKRVAFKEKQRQNGLKGGRPKNPTHNPNKTQPITQTQSQKKPLEDENEIENENENENEVEVELVFPFVEQKFRNAWEAWKQYRREMKLKAYVPKGEQTQLNRLGKLCSTAQEAIDAIEYSIAQSYQGIHFERKNNGKQQRQSLEQVLAQIN